MDELWRWPATELARAIRARRISSREAVEACLERTRQVNPALNAIVDVLDEAALAAADAADRAVAAGAALGALHGVPVTTKVNVDQTGCRTTNGLVALKDAVATEDSPVVANLKRAGAVIFGRTNTPAFSMRWFTENDLHGRTLNPWHRDRTPGGSSGGASAAVAAGMGPIAHGNDLAGSVRYPAYCTGLYGLRPSFGRVPAFLPSAKEERTPGTQLMSVQGPLARTVADVRVALAAMAAADARDPWWVPAPLVGAAPARPIRVALSTTVPGTTVHPAVVEAVERAGAWLAEAGYAVERVEPPRMEEAIALWGTLSAAEIRSTLAETIERLGDAGIRRSLTGLLKGGQDLDLAGYVRALASRTGIVRTWNAFLERYPLVLQPVSAEPAFPQGLDVGSDADMDRVRLAQGTQFLIPVLGLPSISAPLGRAEGVPIGVQLTAARFREDLVLDAAEVLESRQPSPAPIDPEWLR
ncbi:MAG: amidase family protein [Burkholderiales bacterium]